MAEWELRIDRFRVFYDVDVHDEVQKVKIVAVGYKKGDRLFTQDEEFKL